MSTQLIYVASRLTGRTPIKRQYELRDVSKFCAGLVQRGVSVYSPVCHRCQIANHAEGLETNELLFSAADRQILDVAACVIILGSPCEMAVLAAREARKDVIYVKEWSNLDRLAVTLLGCYEIPEGVFDA